MKLYTKINYLKNNRKFDLSQAYCKVQIDVINKNIFEILFKKRLARPG